MQAAVKNIREPGQEISAFVSFPPERETMTHIRKAATQLPLYKPKQCKFSCSRRDLTLGVTTAAREECLIARTAALNKI